MGKAAKNRKQEFRAKQKSMRKAQQKALYESYKKAGTNSKRNKAKKKKAIHSVRIRRHAAPCGNVGCSRDYPDLAQPKFNDSNDPRVRFKTREQQLA